MDDLPSYKMVIFQCAMLNYQRGPSHNQTWLENPLYIEVFFVVTPEGKPMNPGKNGRGTDSNTW